MPLEPITPFEPIQTETIPAGSNWIAQVKWDGVRMLTYHDGNKTQLINRKRMIARGNTPNLPGSNATVPPHLSFSTER